MLDKKENESGTKLEAEFDFLADQYRSDHQKNIAITGETPDFFSEYKISDLSEYFQEKYTPKTVLDFGCGIGNSIPYFRKYFSESRLSCSDVSERSLEHAQSRFKGEEVYMKISNRVPADNESQDLVFSACVFHHIPHEEHDFWLKELHRVTKKGGNLAIFEHNPLNPLTLHAVNTCPLDVNAKLIKAYILRERALAAGWRNVKIAYKIFFPGFLSRLRPLEKKLTWCTLGAQYRLIAEK